MFSTFKARFGAPGVVAVIALVLAMVGGAYAAGGALSGKQKKEVEKIAKKISKAGPQGPEGKQGPKGDTGAVGAVGAKGDKGDKGEKGDTGAAGKSVKVTPIQVGDPGECEESGGAMVTPEGGDGVEVCNGEEGAEGSPWTAGGVLPSGKSEEGTWGASAGAEEFTPDPISFNIPLAATIAGANTHIAPNASCPGTVAEPKAAAGHFCLYVAENVGATIAIGPASGGTGVGKAGGIVAVEGTSGSYAFGTWAVTAP